MTSILEKTRKQVSESLCHSFSPSETRRSKPDGFVVTCPEYHVRIAVQLDSKRFRREIQICEKRRRGETGEGEVGGVAWVRKYEFCPNKSRGNFSARMSGTRTPFDLVIARPIPTGSASGGAGERAASFSQFVFPIWTHILGSKSLTEFLHVRYTIVTTENLPHLRLIHTLYLYILTLIHIPMVTKTTILR